MTRTLGLHDRRRPPDRRQQACSASSSDLAAFVLSRGRDGFDKGLFPGASVALMVLGAYLLGSAMRSSRNAAGDRTTATTTWLPSRDER